MPPPSPSLQLSQDYWNHAAETYEQAFTGTTLGKLWRAAVWRELDAGFESGSRVLELNCGTGIDAIHLARRGVSVLACDISPRMIERARENASAAGLPHLLDFRVLATEQLAILDEAGTFAGAFSNFSGLNCVQDLAAVRRNLARLLKPGSRMFLCMLGKCAAWDRLCHLAHADLREAFRTSSHIPGPAAVQVQRPSCKRIAGLFAPDFKLCKWKGIGVAVPPAYLEHWASRFPGFTQRLDRVDRLIGHLPVLRSLGGCMLLEFERMRSEETEG